MQLLDTHQDPVLAYDRRAGRLPTSLLGIREYQRIAGAGLGVFDREPLPAMEAAQLNLFTLSSNVGRSIWVHEAT